MGNKLAGADFKYFGISPSPLGWRLWKLKHTQHSIHNQILYTHGIHSQILLAFLYVHFLLNWEFIYKFETEIVVGMSYGKGNCGLFPLMFTFWCFSNRLKKFFRQPWLDWCFLCLAFLPCMYLGLCTCLYYNTCAIVSIYFVCFT